MPKYTVTYEQAGQKIIQFTQKILSIPEVVAHKLIRKGTIRINSKRVKPFVHIVEGDIIYLPAHTEEILSKPQHASNNTKMDILPYIVYEDTDLLILNKPAHIPVHNGTRHTDSIASRIASLYAGSSFIPTLVHRLDKDTTGILLLAKSHSMLTTLHEYWRANTVEKYYLAWVRGLWEDTLPSTIHNTLSRTDERVVIDKEEGSPVSITVRCMQHARASSLLLIQLHTGKTHQIRAQLAHKGFPIVGENKYANNAKKLPLYLHSTAIYITEEIQFYAIPSHWQGSFSVHLASNTVLQSNALHIKNTSSLKLYTPEFCKKCLE